MVVRNPVRCLVVQEVVFCNGVDKEIVVFAEGKASVLASVVEVR